MICPSHHDYIPAWGEDVSDLDKSWAVRDINMYRSQISSS